jgi:N-acetylglutamate synthase
MSRFLEELSINALPALQSIVADGWLLRFSKGYFRRANAVHPLELKRPFDTQIAFVEACYQARGLPPLFKLTPDSADLDGELAARGYQRDGQVFVQTCALSILDAPLTTQVQILPVAAPAWLDLQVRWGHVPTAKAHLYRRILTGIAVPAASFIVTDPHQQPRAVGLGVVERGYVGLFALASDPAALRQGLATQLITHIAAWARSQGATQAYLQVGADNLPARTLYQKLGFRDVYDYWYRQKG